MKEIAKITFREGDIYELDDFLLEQVGSFFNNNIKNYIKSERYAFPDLIKFDADYEIVIKKADITNKKPG